MSKILEGKKGLVVGIANDHSIAWGIAKSLSDEGASMYLTYQNDSIKKVDALSHGYTQCDYIITNPPWNRKILHPMIEHFVDFKPTWLLFDADWMHTKQSISYLKHLSKVVSIGRVKWIEGSSSVGKDNCCWYLFENNSKKTEFFGRKDLTLL